MKKQNRELEEILELLDKYNYIYERQLELLVGENTKKVLNLLKTKGIIKIDEEKIVSLNGLCNLRVDEELLKMIWVVCDIKTKIIAHYPTDKFSIITTGKEDIEIINCKLGNEDVIDALYCDKNISKIIIVENVEQTKKINTKNIKSFVILQKQDRKYFLPK